MVIYLLRTYWMVHPTTELRSRKIRVNGVRGEEEEEEEERKYGDLKREE